MQNCIIPDTLPTTQDGMNHLTNVTNITVIFTKPINTLSFNENNYDYSNTEIADSIWYSVFTSNIIHEMWRKRIINKTLPEIFGDLSC